MKRGAALFRLAHAAVAVVELWALGWVWGCAVTRRRGRALAIAVGLLVAEGVALVIGRGNCPLGPLQRRLGDPVPLFELVLPPRAAKAAIPTLFGVAIAGLVGLVLRPPARPAARGRQHSSGVHVRSPGSERGSTTLWA